MATQKQLAAAKKNVKKAQEARRKTPENVSTPKLNRRTRASTGEGEFYRIEVRPKEEFVIFRNQDVGNKGGIERLAGKRPSGSWDTATWLVSKNCAHVENEELVADKPEVKELFDMLGSPPIHIEGDIFKAKDRRNVTEKENPTMAQKSARSENINKAQGAGSNR
jgi:hypothetical protein